MAGFRSIWFSLALSLVFKSLVATEDVTVPYNDLTFLPSKADWVEYAADCATAKCCNHMADNGPEVSIEYTFTGTAIKFYIPNMTNGAKINITFSDGSTLYYNSNGNAGCGSWVGFIFPAGQYKSLTVRLRPDDYQQLYINIEKSVVTRLTAAEYSAFEAQSATSISIQSTRSLASVTSLVTSTGIGGASANQESSSTKSNPASIVGGVLGSLLGLLLLGILAFLWRRRKQQADIQAAAQSPMVFAPPQGHTSPPLSPTSAMIHPQQHSMQQAPLNDLYKDGSPGSPPMQHSPGWNPDHSTTQALVQPPFIPNPLYQGPQGYAGPPITAGYIPQSPSSSSLSRVLPPPDYRGPGAIGPATSRALPQIPNRSGIWVRRGVGQETSFNLFCTI